MRTAYVRLRQRIRPSYVKDGGIRQRMRTAFVNACVPRAGDGGRGKPHALPIRQRMRNSYVNACACDGARQSELFLFFFSREYGVASDAYDFLSGGLSSKLGSKSAE